MPIEAIGIIGASTLGASIAELFVKNGFQVRIYDNFKDSLNIAMAKIRWSLKKEDKMDLFENIEPIQEYEKFNGADIVIEAISKSVEERNIIFSKIVKHLTPNCIIAAYCNIDTIKNLLSNISCLDEERTIALNFVNPVSSNNLVEIVKTDRTPDIILEEVGAMLSRIGKTSVIVKDNPGQIVERIARVYTISAFKVLYSGKGFPSEIDSAFKKISGAEIGPLEYVDYIGLDYDYNACLSIWQALGKVDRFKPSDIETRLVQYGQLGKKTTIGIYIYEDGKIVGENPMLENIVKYLGLKKVSEEEIFSDIIKPIIEESRILASEIMASEYDIEKSLKLAFNWPKGPFSYSREMPDLLEVKKKSEFDNLDTF